jgi:two-component system sensor histidine kinase KdpD
MGRILKNYGISLIAIGAVTAALAPFASELNSATVSLALLLVVLIIAAVFGSRPAFLASVAAVLCFNFFFLPPFYTFTIADPQNWVAFSAFLATALIAGQLSGYARRRADEAERQKQEIERLYTELQAAFEKAAETEALKRSEKLKSALLDAVTHDLRTPLTSIKAAATTLLEDKREKFLDGEGRKELLDIINEESDRLNKFIEGMVGLARIEAHALQGRRAWGVVDEIISNAVERASGFLGARHIVIDLEDELPSVFADSSALSEVVYTLLDNAAKYSPVDSKIRISARRARGEMIEIAVEDEGRGVIPKMREKVFSKFFRAENEDIHASSGGLGLGLAIARGIIESQGGRIWIEDGRDGFITRVAFVVPIGDEDE